ncbi:MarR family transcriptional regulator [Candidatus Saccharibacteria bacterium]|nr:MarR family transcriptional regulator [Candidatus Saccharibacteria bacterium]
MISKPKQTYDIAHITTYQAGVLQASVNRRLQKISDGILEPFGISKTQWLIIGTVLDAGKKGIRISELAEQVSTTLPYLTNTINLLESKKMLSRKTDEEDSRSKYVTVNPKFIPITKEIETELRNGLRQAVYRHVDPSEFQIYVKVLFKLESID